MGRFQSGQMDQTVNLTSSTSVVRIHLCPPQNSTQQWVLFCGIRGVLKKRRIHGGSHEKRPQVRMDKAQNLTARRHSRGRFEPTCPIQDAVLHISEKTRTNLNSLTKRTNRNNQNHQWLPTRVGSH